MNILAIDTSTDKAMVSLLVGETWGHKCQDGVKTHAEFVLPMIQTLLSEFHIEISMLDGIAFGLGPGSFTGLRVAASIVKGLAFASDIAVYPVNSFDAIFASACWAKAQPTLASSPRGLSTGSMLALIDARMSELYWQYQDKDGKRTAIQVSKPEDIQIEGTDNLTITGVGFEPYLPLLSESLQSRIKSTHISYPNTDAMIRLVLANAVVPVDVNDALPLYIRNQVTQGAVRG